MIFLLLSFPIFCCSCCCNKSNTTINITNHVYAMAYGPCMGRAVPVARRLLKRVELFPFCFLFQMILFKIWLETRISSHSNAQECWRIEYFSWNPMNLKLLLNIQTYCSQHGMQNNACRELRLFLFLLLLLHSFLNFTVKSPPFPSLDSCYGRIVFERGKNHIALLTWELLRKLERPTQQRSIKHWLETHSQYPIL